jgi:hypothetical protein
MAAGISFRSRADEACTARSSNPAVADCAAPRAGERNRHSHARVRVRRAFPRRVRLLSGMAVLVATTRRPHRTKPSQRSEHPDSGEASPCTLSCLGSPSYAPMPASLSDSQRSLIGPVGGGRRSVNCAGTGRESDIWSDVGGASLVTKVTWLVRYQTL